MSTAMRSGAMQVWFKTRANHLQNLILKLLEKSTNADPPKITYILPSGVVWI